MLFLLACVQPSGDDSAVDPNAYLKGTAPLAEVSGGECPDLDGGNARFTSNGVDRKIQVLLPDGDTAGKPVVFAWYPLGGSANWLINTLDLEEYATTNDAVVIVPTAADGAEFEWGFVGDATNDLTLFDDVRTCLYQELDIDLGRVSSMGFSAGALWTSYLSVHRGDTLSTILTFSGGTDPVIEYETPAGQYPAFLNYGGDTDLYGGGLVDFTETTLNFAESLTADGHFVVLCDHELGHTIPPEGRDMMDAWLTAHVYGEASPFADGDISAFPDYCAVYE